MGTQRLFVAGLAFLFSTLPAMARDLSFSMGHPPQSYFAQGGNAFAATIEEETGGALKARVFPMSLLSMAETSAGVRDGLADLGAVMIPYHGAEYAHTNLILDSSMVLNTYHIQGKDGPAYAAAVSEFIFTKCPECIAEFTRQNQVYLAGAGSSRYALNCRKPIVATEDLKASRLRVGGANWARWAVAVGATPITMPGDEMLEGLAQGLLDCVVLSVADVHNFGLSGSIRDVTLDVPGGVFIAAFANINADTWRNLSRTERTALMKGVAKGSAITSWSYFEGEVKVLEAFKAKGGIVHEAESVVADRTSTFVEDDLRTLTTLYQDRGVSRGERMLFDFRQILGKWLELTKTVASEKELGELYWSELYSKVDVATYGN